MNQFTLKTAQQAKEQGELELWVHTYLMGPANNVPFVDGLKREKRYWRGPLEISLSRLKRMCGPEADMPYRVLEDHWLEKTQRIAKSFEVIENFPPLIVSIVDGIFQIDDGNHRYQAFSSLGLESCWIILWYPALGDYQRHEERDFEV